MGLFPGARWQTALDGRVEGISYLANLPSEEVATTPDPARTEGRVRSTRPLVLAFGDGDPGLLRERDRPRRNASATHVDFMIGGEEVEVTGVTRDGRRLPLLAGGRWLL